LILQISDRSLPISFLMYLRFCSVMDATASRTIPKLFLFAAVKALRGI